MLQRREIKLIQSLLVLLLCLCVLGACRNTHTVQQNITTHASSTGIGPYTEFTGRLLVIQKAKRWQVMLNWKAKTPDQGWLRLHHAASSRVIEVKWQDHHLQTRDNNDRPPRWHSTTPAYLQQQGINISPEDLTLFLLGQLPQGFYEKKKNEWHGYRGKSVLRVVWNPNRQSLMIMDMHQGSKIVLLIL